MSVRVLKRLYFFRFFRFARINRFFYIYQMHSTTYRSNSMLHLHRSCPLPRTVYALLSEFQLVLPNFSFFLSLACFFPSPFATNFFFSTTNSKKKILHQKINLYSSPTLASTSHTPLLHWISSRTLYTLDELLLGDSFSHGRSLSARRLLPAPQSVSEFPPNEYVSSLYKRRSSTKFAAFREITRLPRNRKL